MYTSKHCQEKLSRLHDKGERYIHCEGILEGGKTNRAVKDQRILCDASI